ncbi:MAG: DUF4097 family beta strand repeat protein [Erysipelotrichaceae bacterium]|nr:DUF4097 family beta strand repeat protein [Erysipelotrichaceae bacterium]
MKRNGFLIGMIIILTAMIIGIWTLYNAYYMPDESTTSSYMEVYQEIESAEANNLIISSINHDLVIRPSEDDKIKITYFQKLQNNNEYNVANKTITLRMTSRVESNAIASKKAIQTITVFLPADIINRLSFNSVDGNLDLANVRIRDLIFNAVNGEAALNTSSFWSMNVTSNYGDLLLEDCSFDRLYIRSQTSAISLKMLEDLAHYTCNLSTRIGTLQLNGERVHEIIETEGETRDEIVNVYAREGDPLRTLQIESNSGNISLKYPIDELQPVEPQPSGGEGNETVTVQ